MITGINEIVYPSIEDAIKDLKLDRRFKYYVFQGELCIKDKKVGCPTAIVRMGKPVKIREG